MSKEQKEKYVFSDDLFFGQKRELVFFNNYVTNKDWIERDGGKNRPDFIFKNNERTEAWDLKSDRKSGATNNFFFETSHNGVLSGVYSEKVKIDKIIYEIYEDEIFKADRYYIFETKTVKEILENPNFNYLKKKKSLGVTEGFTFNIELFVLIYNCYEL